MNAPTPLDRCNARANTPRDPIYRVPSEVLAILRECDELLDEIADEKPTATRERIDELQSRVDDLIGRCRVDGTTVLVARERVAAAAIDLLDAMGVRR